MMKVWLSNIIQKNPVSGKSILVKDKNDDITSNRQDEQYNNKKNAAELFSTEIIDYFELIEKLKYRIIPNQQLYGDSFVEVINLDDYDMLDQENDGNSFLHESSIQPQQQNKKEKQKILSESEILKITQSQIKKDSLTESDVDKICDNFANLFVDVDESVIFAEDEALTISQDRHIVLQENKKSKNVESGNFFYEYFKDSVGKVNPELKFIQEQKEESVKKRGRPKKEIYEEKKSFNDVTAELGIETDIDLSKVLILVHHPKNILVLETTYGTKLGYVEIANKDIMQSSINVGQSR